MKLKEIARSLTVFALAGGLSMLCAASRAQSQTGLRSPALSGESVDVSRVTQIGGPVGPSPGAFGRQIIRGPLGGTVATIDSEGSHIDNYINQDEQINLDANTGNVRVLRTNQKALLNDFVTVTYELERVDPREIRNVLGSIVGLEGGDAVSVYDLEGKQHYIQVICPRYMVPYLDQAVPLLDETWVREYYTGTAEVYYNAKNRGAAAIDAIASEYASENGFSRFDTTNNAVARIDEPYRIRRYLTAAEIVDIPANQVRLEVKIYEVSSTNDLKLGLDYINWKNGPGRNLFQFVYQGFDAQSRNETFTSIFDPFTSADAAGLSPGNETKFLNDTDQFFRSVNYLLPTNYIDFLQVRGEARVKLNQEQRVKSANTSFFSVEDEVVALVSTPGNSAEIFSDVQNGQLPGLDNDLTRVRTSGNFGGRGGGPDRGTRGPTGPTVVQDSDGRNVSVAANFVPVRNSSRRLHYNNAGKTGIFVEMTPFVGLESMELVIDVEIGDLNGLASNGQPIINTRTISTTARLLDGEPYVLAGIKKRHDIKENQEAPGLGDIPILGYLFGGETEVKRNTDVVIVVVPHFELSGMTDIYTPQRVKDLAEVVEDGRMVQLQDDHVGYDKWLFGYRSSR